MAIKVQRKAPLTHLNTFGVAATAEYLVTVGSPEDFLQVQHDPSLASLPRMVLGGGSNVLFTQDYPGLIVRVDARGVQDVGDTVDDWLVAVGAGECWHSVVEQLIARSRPGLENLALIPGLAGAAPIQNIGAYGLEVGQRLHSVDVWDVASERLIRMSAEECQLGYRDSIFKKHSGDQETRAIMGMTLALPKRWQPVLGYTELAQALAKGSAPITPRCIFDAVCAIRRRKLPDPEIIGNAGSFFKNPMITTLQARTLKERFPSLVSYVLGEGHEKLSAGWLIESCGLKGATRGRAGVYEKQALVLVNRGGATGTEILALAREVQEKVYEKFGIALEPEPKII